MSQLISLCVGFLLVYLGIKLTFRFIKWMGIFCLIYIVLTCFM